ncbi:Alpha/Beta hydrolase protein [Schizophyllum amplum]|uniref:feruloyl esterase n=1 Tax=Schizophyllum amplum TaxID=97359 RepID=A0A550C1W4_9AGAR|nr:Alpha/Beta hydrolase protein [Auriculariopsis ampla]
MAGIILTGLSVLTSLIPADAAFVPYTASTLRSRSGTNSSSGCDSDVSWDFDHDHHHVQNTTVGGEERTYLVHIPENYNHSLSHSLVVSFHGASANMYDQEQASQLSIAGQRLNGMGVITVFPQGLEGDNGRTAWRSAPYANEDADDIDFTGAVLNEVFDNLCVDQSRVYASGKSNGGGFTNRLACNANITSRFAAYGLISGAYYPDSLSGDDCKPGRKVPVLISHGDADETIKFDGETSDDDEEELPSINDFAENWAYRNGYEKDDYEMSQPHNDTNLWTWGDDGDEGQVRRYRIKGMDHIWPSTIEGLDADGKSAPFNITESDLLPFFDQYTL